MADTKAKNQKFTNRFRDHMKLYNEGKLKDPDGNIVTNFKDALALSSNYAMNMEDLDKSGSFAMSPRKKGADKSLRVGLTESDFVGADEGDVDNYYEASSVPTSLGKGVLMGMAQNAPVDVLTEDEIEKIKNPIEKEVAKVHRARRIRELQAHKRMKKEK